MTKALFKKQMMESFSWLYMDKKTGKVRSKSRLIAYAALYLFLFGFLAVMFYGVAVSLCEPLVEANIGWLYFAMMGLISIVLGVFGSVFNTFASLYQAKDNDLLLSLPIPTGKILAMRLSGVYVMGLMYELIVMVPALIVWFTFGEVGAAGIFFSLLIPFVLSLFVLTLSCILGWVVALVSSRVKNKSFVTVVLSLAFIAGYYYIYFRAYSLLTNILANLENIAESVKSILYPFYHMGLAAEGNAFSMLIFTVIVAVLFGAVYLVLSGSFLKLATTNKGAAKVKYKEGAVKINSADSALLRKELKRFVGSPTYMMNCGLGVVLMIVAGVLLVVKGEFAVELLNGLFGEAKGIISLLAAAMICMMTTMNDITAPSVSLEGKTIWLVQVLPVSAWQVLKAKLKLHLLLTLIPAAVLVTCVEIVILPTLGYAILIPVVTVLFVVFMAAVGLVVNLKFPNLNWTNETAPVKQGLGVMIALFGGWIIVIALGLLYYVLMDLVGPMQFFVFAAILLLAGCAVALTWLKKKGAEIFARL